MKWKRFNLAALLAVLWFVAGASIHAQGVPRLSQPIEFSDAKVQVTTSNLNRGADISINALRPMDGRLIAPYRLQDDASRIDGAQRGLPTTRPPTLDPRAVRELMDKRKEKDEWLFESPDELETVEPTPESMFGIPEFEADGTEKTTDKSAKRLLERGNHDRYGSTNRMIRETTFERTDEEIKAQARVFFGLPVMPGGNDSANGLNPVSSSTMIRSLTTKPIPDLGGGGRSSTALFGTPSGSLPLGNEASAARLEEYRQLFGDVKSPNSAAGGALGDFSGSRATRPGAFNDPSPTTSWRPPPVTGASGFGSISRPSETKPLGFTPAPVLTSPTPAPATMQPQRPMTPPAGFQLPKRTF